MHGRSASAIDAIPKQEIVLKMHEAGVLVGEYKGTVSVDGYISIAMNNQME
ncbi:MULTISPECIES: hypothetical protein [Sphingobacterium]|uniref:Uncharacterized protein n=1 Tax=Sphingobacterium populi TaxID=1812824 RepID=A0ABW5UAG1_9SPHI|nr:hypothetical protein [Sphingobacterium sp. CFCC 11742]